MCAIPMKVCVGLGVILVIVACSASGTLYSATPPLAQQSFQSTNRVQTHPRIEETMTPFGTVLPFGTSEANFPILEDIPTSTIGITTNEISGHLYVWQPPGYGVLNPNIFQSFMSPLSPTDPFIKSPSSAISFAFSNQSQLIAYMTYDEHVELWIGDLNLGNVSRLQAVDDNDWLQVFSDYDNVPLKWGPRDKYLIFTTINHKFILNLDDKSVSKLSEPCDTLTLASETKEVVIWCLLEEGGVVGLNSEGELIKTSSIPPSELVIQVIDWVFSPDGNKVLLSTNKNQVLVLEKTGKLVEIPIAYFSPSFDVSMKVFQWLEDSSRIFIYGYSQNVGICSESEDEINPCWLLIDASSGEVLWASKAIHDVLDATISPDGEWVAMFFIEPKEGLLLRFGVVIAISNNDQQIIYDGVVHSVQWGE